MATERTKPRKAWLWVRVTLLVLILSSCAQMLGFQHDVGDGACKTDQDCAPDKLCLLQECGLRCNKDDDCSILFRCLKTTRGNACVDSRTGCGASCPAGTSCADDGQCRTTCLSTADCLAGQYCPESFCTGVDKKHDPTTGDAAVGGSGGSSGAGGAGTTGGAGGTRDAGTVDAGPIVADCNGDHVPETTLGTVEHCSTCGESCTVQNGTANCLSRVCGVESCNTGFEDCDHDYKTGCEADLTSDTTCGACGIKCVAPAGGSASCVAGACKITSCPAGFDDCDGTYANGCETPLNTLTDCGKCQKPCAVANGTPSCVTGSCEIACAQCGGQSGDGGLDASTPPPLPSVDAGGDGGNGCTPGACAKQACDKGFGDCDGDPGTGCETDLQTSLSDCGSCHAACNYAHASEDCVAGKCTFQKCDTGWANCAGGLADGCETDLSGAPYPGNSKWISHCGACGTICNPPNGSALCVPNASSYVCQLNSCAATFFTTPDTSACGCKIQVNVDSAPTCTLSAAIQIDQDSSRTFTASEPDGQDDWYHFTLPGVNASRATRYRTRMSVTVTAGFLMEVKDTTCAGSSTKNTCPGEASNDPTAVDSWDWFDPCTGSSGEPGVQPAYQCTNLVSSALLAPEEIWVRVYSKGVPMCATYDLKVVRDRF